MKNGSLSLQFQRLGQLLPLAVAWHLDGVTFLLFQNVYGVVLAGEGSRQVFAAEVVDELHFGLLAVLDIAGCNHPAEGVMELA